VDEQDYVVAQLAALGLKPGDITYLVATHLDPDHAGGTNEFPDSEIVIQREHLEAARAEVHPRFAVTRTNWDAPGLRYKVVEGDTELIPGVELIAASGHVPGLQAVLVRLPQTGPVLLASDAMTLDMDEAGVRASTRKQLDLAEREGVKLIIYGHNAAQWKTLRTAPEFYE
jgi:N-acyl homoserine lactone hydrolase